MGLVIGIASAVVLAPALLVQATPPFEDNPVPDLFAGLMNVTLSREISAATFRIDNGGPNSDPTRFRTYKLPWSREVDVGSPRGTLHVGAVAGLLRAEDGLHIDSASGLALADEEWTAIGAQLELGWTRALGRRWALRPGLALALAYMRNDTSYNAAGQTEIAPQADGIFLNWDAWATIGTAFIAVERTRESGRLSSGLAARYALTSTRTFAASSDVQEDTDTSRFFLLRGEIGGPSPWWRAASSAEWDVFAGWSALGDVDVDALGFDEFFELGAGLSFRVPRLPRLRLGGSWLVGPDVRGFSLGLGLGS